MVLVATGEDQPEVVGDGVDLVGAHQSLEQDPAVVPPGLHLGIAGQSRGHRHRIQAPPAFAFGATAAPPADMEPRPGRSLAFGVATPLDPQPPPVAEGNGGGCAAGSPLQGSPGAAEKRVRGSERPRQPAWRRWRRALPAPPTSSPSTGCNPRSASIRPTSSSPGTSATAGGPPGSSPTGSACGAGAPGRPRWRPGLGSGTPGCARDRSRPSSPTAARPCRRTRPTSGRVRTWAASGGPGPPAALAAFDTGLLHADWRAKWIWRPTAMAPPEYTYARHRGRVVELARRAGPRLRRRRPAVRAHRQRGAGGQGPGLLLSRRPVLRERSTSPRCCGRERPMPWPCSTAGKGPPRVTPPDSRGASSS